MKTIYYKENNLDLSKVRETLEGEGIIGFPTETVYGLGAYLSKERAIKRIYELKGRPLSKPFIVHLASVEDVSLVADEIPEIFYKLARAFMPGPLTVVLKKKKDLPCWISSSETIAVRIPSHPLTLRLLKTLKEPIVGTSANLSNEKNTFSADEVSHIFQDKIDLVIDGGVAEFKLPSTILSLVHDMKILRIGKITLDEIKKIIG